jgi:hypothetical protein
MDKVQVLAGDLPAFRDVLTSRRGRRKTVISLAPIRPFPKANRATSALLFKSESEPESIHPLRAFPVDYINEFPRILVEFKLELAFLVDG